MKLFRTILRQPIKDTLIILLASFVALCTFALISILIGKLTFRDMIPGGENIYLSLLRSVVQDFAYISKIVFELSCVILIAQGIDRLRNRNSQTAD